MTIKNEKIYDKDIKYGGLFKQLLKLNHEKLFEEFLIKINPIVRINKVNNTKPTIVCTFSK